MMSKLRSGNAGSRLKAAPRAVARLSALRRRERWATLLPEKDSCSFRSPSLAQSEVSTARTERRLALPGRSLLHPVQSRAVGRYGGPSCESGDFGYANASRYRAGRAGVDARGWRARVGRFTVMQSGLGREERLDERWWCHFWLSRLDSRDDAIGSAHRRWFTRIHRS